MAKTNISFNDKNYNIEIPSTALAALQSHLSTVMNGSGATINLGDTAYSVDSAKLSTATNAFVSHLGTVAGNGYKVVVNGVEYGVDATKLASAVTELETVLGGLNSAGGSDTLYWDGNTEGLTRTDLGSGGAINFYKVSNIAPSKQDFSNGCRIYIVDSMFEISADVAQSSFTNGICMLDSNKVFINTIDQLDIKGDGSLIIEKGTYFLHDGNVGVSALTIIGYTGF